jgi:LacI family transcriptional regulator
LLAGANQNLFEDTNLKKLNSSEIAKLAGVSRSTVSRVINGYTNVPDTTREHVMKVIRENEYYPMLSGQLLAGKNTNTLGLFWITGSSLADDLQGCAYLAHLTECAAERGYLVLTSIVKNLSAQENVDWIKRIFMQGRIDAGIFIGADNNEPLIEELISKGKVVGVFD